MPLNRKPPKDTRSADDIYNQGPAGGPALATQSKYVGVPDDYTAVRPMQENPHYYPSGFSYTTGRYGAGAAPSEQGRYEQKPRYRDGDEWKPANLPGGPEAIAELQRQLVNAGYLSGRFQLGRWDPPSVAAYKDLLSEANASGLDAETALRRFGTGPVLNAGRGGGGSGGGGVGGGQIVGFDENGNPIYAPFQAPPLELKTTNKDDLRRVFRQAVIDKLGEGWDQAKINELVDAYNWKEIQVQKGAYDQQVAAMRADYEGTQGPDVISSVDVPSPETFLDTQLQERDPVGYQAGQITQDLIPSVLGNLRGWV